MKILELFNNQREDFSSDIISNFNQAAGTTIGSGNDKSIKRSSESSPFAGANPKALKQALANIINGQPLDSSQIQIFKKAYNQL